MADDLTKYVTTFILILLLIGMMAFVAIRAKKNRKNMIDNLAPKIAGEDELEGGARNPQRFDEPDEEALEEMAELLGEDSDNEA